MALRQCSALRTLIHPRGAAALLRPLGGCRAFGDSKGVVKFFNPERGFGFITSGEKDYFIHYTGIESGGGFKSLEDGEDVEFDIEVDHDGKQRAVRVTGPGGAPVRGSSRPKAAPGEEL
mmetsp:Transcript_78705/g.213105  ORF Transcript_78705/g.213105 Transcript_78705/m.213105 type:complete len:119 (+) Transcript_78705:81-437(+)